MQWFNTVTAAGFANPADFFTTYNKNCKLMFFDKKNGFFC